MGTPPFVLAKPVYMAIYDIPCHVRDLDYPQITQITQILILKELDVPQRVRKNLRNLCNLRIVFF